MDDIQGGYITRKQHLCYENTYNYVIIIKFHGVDKFVQSTTHFRSSVFVQQMVIQESKTVDMIR